MSAVCKLTFALFGFLLINILHIYSLPAESELRFVIVVYRHGDRTPLETFPKDKYNESYWPSGWGQLTNIGKEQQYELGKWLRQRYNGFLPEEYNERDFHAESTDFSRTLMSAYSNLAGLYEPVGKDIWKKNIPWQPIPVHFTSVHLDYSGEDGNSCDKYNALRKELYSSEEVLTKAQRYSEIFKNLSLLSGSDISPTGFRSAGFIYYTFFIEETHSLELPSWAYDYYPDPLEDVYHYSFQLAAFNIPMRRIKCGPFLKEILNRIDEKINGSLTAKMWQYSTHDNILVDLMQCLDLFEGKVPPYAGALILELHQQKSKYFVEILYRKNQILKRMAIPGCNTHCPLNVLKELVSPVIPYDKEEECRVW